MGRDEVLRMAKEAGLRAAVLLGRYGTEEALTDTEIHELGQIERFAALVAAACLAAERAMMPPTQLVVDVSSIDPGMLADMMKRARQDSAPALVSGAPTVAAAVAAEREACAKVLDQMAEEAKENMEPSCRIAYYREKAWAIRARGTA